MTLKIIACYKSNMILPQKGKILFLAAHPYLEKSRANRAVVRAVSEMEGVTLHVLYERYPYFHIDIAYEKELLLAHEIVVLQHPMYWYSMPALLKLWLDDVFESGWAYGPGGDKLKGKKFLVSLTMGGSKEAYAPQGQNRFDMQTFLAPWNQTAHLCQMQWLEPCLFHRSIRATDAEIESHAQLVKRRLEGLLMEVGRG